MRSDTDLIFIPILSECGDCSLAISRAKLEEIIREESTEKLISNEAYGKIKKE